MCDPDYVLCKAQSEAEEKVDVKLANKTSKKNQYIAV
jgi:hypothetical protein